MNPRPPVWLIIVLAVQLALTLLLFAVGWSYSASAGQGRPPSLADTIALTLPILAVALLGAGAIAANRAGQRALSVVLALLPLPTILVLFGIVGVM